MNKNKGFSLVELIVVVAIMAVLVGILAPAYLSYVEKTRRGTDENMAEEVRHTIEIATADICVYDEVVNSLPKTYTFSCQTPASIKSAAAAGSKMEEALDDVYGTKKFECKSKKYKQKTSYTVTVTSSSNGTALSVAGQWNQ